MSDTYVTPTELLASGETVDDIVTESADYVPYELLPPTNKDANVGYISKKRDVKLTKKTDKNGRSFFSVEISFNELENLQGEKITLSRPIRTWINTIQFGQRNRPGTTSSVSDYLGQCGFSPKEMTGEQVLEALGESAAIPLEAILGWTNMTSKTGNKLPNGKDEYTEEVCKTADFNTGTKENPSYAATLVKDGVEYKAKHRLVAFRRI
jgi:hypothetical protein